MKKIGVFFLLSLATLIHPCYCQWAVVSYVPTNFLEGVKFFNENTGFVGGYGGVWKTSTGGASWTQVLYTGNSALFALHFIDSSNGYAGGDSVIFRTTNGGLNWSQYTVQVGYYFMEAISFFNLSTGMAVGNGSGNPSFRTTNAGNNWSQSISSLGYSSVHALSNGFGYMVGIGSGYETVWKTTNYGANWQTMGLYAVVVLNDVWAVTSDLVFACGNRGRLRRTTNGGTNWTILDSLTPRNLYAITFANSNTGTVVGNYGVILRTTNSGNNWAIQSSGTTRNLEAICFINATTGWTVGEQGIVLKTTNGGVTPVQQTSTRTPDDFILEQNFPNPFNASTKIKFEIPNEDFVTMIVYDLAGKQIATLINQELRQGGYEIQWNAENFPSGIYFYRMSTTNFSRTGRMMLLK